MDIEYYSKCLNRLDQVNYFITGLIAYTVCSALITSIIASLILFSDVYVLESMSKLML